MTNQHHGPALGGHNRLDLDQAFHQVAETATDLRLAAGAGAPPAILRAWMCCLQAQIAVAVSAQAEWAAAAGLTEEAALWQRLGAELTPTVFKPPITAPFTQPQIEALNAYQDSGFTHAYTCACHSESLIAVERGWLCPVSMDLVQTWAMAETADSQFLQNFHAELAGKVSDR